jgi:hypothetical protein
MDKQELLKQVWRECNLKEILDVGYETESIQAIDIIKEAEQIDRDAFNVSLGSNFIDKLRELFDNTPNHELPYGHEVMEEVSVHYSDSTLMDYFDRDDLIEYCEDSWEMDAYIETKCNDAVNDYITDNPPLDKEEIIRQLQDGMKYKFREFLCDLVDANYHITDEELLNELKQCL